MKTALDQNGSVALPEDVRARLGLRPGDEVDLEEDEGRVILRPVQTGDRGAATEGENGRHTAPEVHVEPNDTGVAQVSEFVN
jgi:AbrB family looped-hinge helix DNA binding protein